MSKLNQNSLWQQIKLGYVELFAGVCQKEWSEENQKIINQIYQEYEKSKKLYE